MSGIVTMNFSSLPPAVPQVKVGNLKALAVTGDHRLSSLPDVPTLKEQGIDTVINGWHGLFRAGQDARRSSRHHREEREAGHDGPKWAEVLAKDGVEVPPSAPAPSSPLRRRRARFWGKQLKALKIDME
jgi:tripartite-type tricarboxylate transporter receptor subunit TctC